MNIRYMNVRDLVAIHAMQAFITAQWQFPSPEVMAEEAYRYADAMAKAGKFVPPRG